MTEPLDIVVRTREGAHKVAELAYKKARALIADGKEGLSGTDGGN